MHEDFLREIWPDWQIIREIGRGSYGIVYEAARTDGITDIRSAVKVIHIPSDPAELNALQSEGLTDAETKTYLQGIVDDCINEVKLMESFKGTNNVVSVEDYKVIEDPEKAAWTIYIRMELLTPLPALLRAGEFDEKETIKLGVDICNALCRCEQLNVIHRDIKPENIFVNSFGDYKIGDFGIAKNLGNMTGSLSMKGTMNYMAPEVEKGKNYDHRADIYSLGLVLYRLMNDNLLPFLERKEQMFNAKERTEALVRRLRGEPLPAPRNASGTFANVILTACDPEPDRRFHSAAAMKEALLSLTEDNKTVKVRPPKPDPDPDVPPITDDKKKRPPLMLIIAVCAVAAAAVALALVLSNIHSEKKDSTKEENSRIVTEDTESSENTSASGDTESIPEKEDRTAQEPEATQPPQLTDEPAPTQEPENTREPLTIQEPEATQTPEPTPESTKTSEPTPEPTKTPEPTPEPTKTSEPTPEPTKTPEPTPEPDEEKDFQKAQGIYYITGNAKNIRSEADYYSDLVCKISDSYLPLYYFGESAVGIGKDNNEHIWYRIYTEAGIIGWIRTEFVSILPGQIDTTALPEIVYITGNAKNIRSESTYHSDLVIKISNSSQPLHFYGETGYGIGKDGNNHLWVKIYTEDGLSGWIQTEYISTEPGQKDS